jgi:sialic acid synthase SpsE
MKFNIDNFQINKTSEVYIVAEIGINHNGDIEIAKELIKVAKKNTRTRRT